MSQFPFRLLLLLGVAILIFAVLVVGAWLGSLDHTMRPIFFFRLVLVIAVAAGLLGSIKRDGINHVKRQIIGGVIGGFLGFLVPLLVAVIYILLGGNSEAAG